MKKSAERQRLEVDEQRESNWKRWGPYLSERQWGTVREDYSSDGDSWRYFPHEHARSRAYRWGEDGLLGITDRQGRLCFALALWNERDRMLKERLFGLTGPEGNHGEDVKEEYYYLDSTPTHSYMKALYKYPQVAFPYESLVTENARRSKKETELELADLGVFAESRYFDVEVEYAKASPNDVLVRITVRNHGPDPAPIHVLPTLWYRNTWSHGQAGEGYWSRPDLRRNGASRLVAEHVSLGKFVCLAGLSPSGGNPEILFTENETNVERLFGTPNPQPWVKDAFHAAIVDRRPKATNSLGHGTKAAFHYRENIAPKSSIELRLRLVAEAEAPKTDPESESEALGAAFDEIFMKRRAEADEFYAQTFTRRFHPDEALVARQAIAGLLWTKQFYYYSIEEWLEGDPSHPPPPDSRLKGRNREWTHLYNRDVISMPDKWEYPWYAAWDLAFHMIPFSRVDPRFAKDQLILFLREWYMHPNGQIPAYEFALSDVNPPVHAWAAWRVYKMTGSHGGRDRVFLARVFHKLLINFTWWVNQKDRDGRHVFSGGFLGLDNIGVFDRSRPSPIGGELDQADATGWMAFYCATMLSIALELSRDAPEYEDIASKFFEHFVAIADAINTFDKTGLWDEQDGFYYDHLHRKGARTALRVRSLVGLIPLITVEILDDGLIERLEGFRKRMEWFLSNRKDLARHISCVRKSDGSRRLLLAIPSRERLERLLHRMLDESEFLSPYGIRSLSRAHLNEPFVLRSDVDEYRVAYVPGESDSYLFGGNSNWRGPVWIPLNYLIIEALERYHRFYGDDLRVECPTGSGRWLDLHEVSLEISARLTRLFLSDASGRRPVHGDDRRYAEDPERRDLVLFYEYFHGDSGRGLGASHQTGWSALVANCLEKVARGREGQPPSES
jgi:hypothetical protein